jgi:hypothetical protein
MPGSMRFISVEKVTIVFGEQKFPQVDCNPFFNNRSAGVGVLFIMC